MQAGQGSGLGLFISAGIVKLHGGKIHVQSEGIGKGTTFTMILPLVYISINNNDCVDVDNNDNNSNNIKHQQTIVENNSSTSYALSTQVKDIDSLLTNKLTKRILVVDDAATNRKMVTRYLAKHGHIVNQVILKYLIL